MTNTQSRVYEFIARKIGEGCPPTMWEISQYFNWASQNAAVTHVNALIAQGVLKKLPGLARGLRLVDVPTLQPAEAPVDVVSTAMELWK